MVRLIDFSKVDDDKYHCQIASPFGEILFDSEVRSRIPDQSFWVIKHAISMQNSLDKYPHASFTISKSSEAGHRKRGDQDDIELAIRIRVPDADSIYDFNLQGFPKGFESFLPASLRPTVQTWSPREFYDSVYVPNKDPVNLPPIEELRCNLLPFQKRAVRWMLEKERAPGQHQSSVTSEPMAYGFQEVADGDGNSCFLSLLLGAITSNNFLTKPHIESPKGGILSEEMGLGKTVEMIALMSLNKMVPRDSFGSDEQQLLSSRTTLIITPPAILQQWRNELDALAPDLNVYIYHGLRAEAEDANHEELLHRLSRQDVVLTTFNVLSKEIHHAEKHERNLRHKKRYEKRLSPLTRNLWWRVVLDEAQMIEGGVSQAARFAMLIPREHAWCVSGTPVKRDFNDIFGLLLFLRYRPYSEFPRLWADLVYRHRHVFKQIVNDLALRHTKDQIKDDLHLPPQKRVVITVPFNQIEEQHYSTMFQDMAEDCGLDSSGAPLEDDWDPSSSTVINKMRTWLTRLRQTCLHPEVGTRNRRALGGRGPLRTVNEVLEVMIEQNQTAARGEERTLILSQLRRGQILEHAEYPQEALDIWLLTLEEVDLIVGECRSQLAAVTEQERRQEARNAEVETGDEQSSRVLPYVTRLRNALELAHICVFFSGNAYYQLKEKEGPNCQKASNLEVASLSQPILASSNDIPSSSNFNDGYEDASPVTDGDNRLPGPSDNAIISPASSKLQAVQQRNSDRSPITVVQLEENKETSEPVRSELYLELERKEEAAYERAKSLRKELLSESRGKADVPIQKLKDKMVSFTQIPRVGAVSDTGGIEYRRVAHKIELSIDLIQRQTKCLEEWRAKTTELLTLPLVDESESDLPSESEAAGKEYETSTKQQDESYVYVDMFRALVSDRHDILTGQRNLLIEHEMKFAFDEAKDGRGHSPQLFRDLYQTRKKLQPSKEIGSIRGLLTELRELKTDLRGAAERNNSRAAAEMLIINDAMKKLQEMSTEQMKAAIALNHEVELFRETMNLRLDFYRQLQAISDSVAPYEENLTEEGRENALNKKLTDEEHLRSRIATLKSKGRYLLHLRSEAANSEDERMCIICQHPFENGILTSCGHTYCRECLQLWWNAHRTCPTCKKHLRRGDFHPITYKPQEMTIQEESTSSKNDMKSANTIDDDQTRAIYSGIHDTILKQIKDIDLDGSSFGTKIDTIARHLLWIRQYDPGAKSIVFSQYKDFLDVLGRAFKQFRIGFASIDRKGGIEDFRHDPSIECFFLHAKAHSSGLNLVNATHVFLCEPLINTALELQAIARVHRIGQQHETTVWMYLVEGTVEKSIYDISVQRRMAHVGRVKGGREGSKGDAEAVLEGQIEAANTQEMEDTTLASLLTKGSGGEMVAPEDLWDCLFRQQSSGSGGRVSDDARTEVAHHLGADAAEARMAVR